MVDQSHMDAAVFDLDGVVTQTAGLHARAWQRTFDEHLRARAARGHEPFRPFSLPQDYLLHVDGKPRCDGARSFLESRRVRIPLGTASDPPEAETICGIGNRKDAYFLEMVQKEGVQVFDSTVTLIRALRCRGVKIAVVTSSRNCLPLLEAAGIAGLFDARIDGAIAEESNLHGKPHPDVFLQALARLGAEPARAFVAEDSVPGVQAGKRGRFAFVIGVDRGGNRAALRAAGADRVVADLEEITLQEIDDWMRNRQHARPFVMVHWDDLQARLAAGRVALFLDYDGTLTPIEQRPELAKLSPDMRETLSRLADRCPTVIVSGRGRDDVSGLVGLENLIYAGDHGFDISGPGETRIHHEVGADLVPDVACAAGELRRRLADVPGVLVEEKRFTVAVHYRLVAQELLGRVERDVDGVLESHPHLVCARGKKVLEVKPQLDWDKGKAVLWLLTALGLDGPEVLPIYVGDDRTDEDAFAALRGRGLGVLVTATPRPTLADYSLQDPEEVRGFLATLAASLDSRSTT